MIETLILYDIINIIMKQVGFFTRDLDLVFHIRNFDPIIASYNITTSTHR